MTKVFHSYYQAFSSKVRLKCDGTCAETRFRLSSKRTSPFKSAGASVQSTAGSRAVCISGSNAGYTMFRGSVRVLATHSIRQFPLHLPSRASQCAIRFQTHSTNTALISKRQVSNFMKITQPFKQAYCYGKTGTKFIFTSWVMEYLLRNRGKTIS